MAKLFTITETIISASGHTLEALVASSLQTWTYTNEEHARLAFASIVNELRVAYPKGNDAEFRIEHEATTDAFTATIFHDDVLAETIAVAFIAKHQPTAATWWETLSSAHDLAVHTRFANEPAQAVVSKSLLSGFGPSDDDGLVSSVQTWTYGSSADALTDFDVLSDELAQEYPLGMHEDGFEVKAVTISDTTTSIAITENGEAYEAIAIELHEATTTPTWSQLQVSYIAKLN